MFFRLITSIFLTEWSLYFPKYTSRKMDLPYSAEHRGSLMWDLTERARSSPHPSKRKQSHSCGKLPNAGNSSWNIQSHTEMQTQAQTHFLRLQFMGRSLIPTHTHLSHYRLNMHCKLPPFMVQWRGFEVKLSNTTANLCGCAPPIRIQPTEKRIWFTCKGDI